MASIYDNAIITLYNVTADEYSESDVEVGNFSCQIEDVSELIESNGKEVESKALIMLHNFPTTLSIGINDRLIIIEKFDKATGSNRKEVILKVDDTLGWRNNYIEVWI